MFTALKCDKTGYRIFAARLSACAVRYDDVPNFKHYKKLRVRLKKLY